MRKATSLLRNCLGKPSASSWLPSGRKHSYSPEEIELILRFSSADRYGRRLNVWDWTTHCLVQSIDLGEDSAPLNVRFLHNPDAPHGFVGCALAGTLHHIFRKQVKTSRISFSSFPTTSAEKERASKPSAQNKLQNKWIKCSFKTTQYNTGRSRFMTKIGTGTFVAK